MQLPFRRGLLECPVSKVLPFIPSPPYVSKAANNGDAQQPSCLPGRHVVRTCPVHHQLSFLCILQVMLAQDRIIPDIVVHPGGHQWARCMQMSCGLLLHQARRLAGQTCSWLHASYSLGCD